jgi:hypothetical protein
MSVDRGHDTTKLDTNFRSSVRPFWVSAWAAGVENLDSVVASGAFLPTMSAMYAERFSKQMDDRTGAVIDQQ